MIRKINRTLKRLLRFSPHKNRADAPSPARTPNTWGAAGRSEIMMTRGLVRMKQTRR